jgi:hypothetical protein
VLNSIDYLLGLRPNFVGSFGCYRSGSFSWCCCVLVGFGVACFNSCLRFRFWPSVVVVVRELSGGFGSGLTTGLAMVWWC